MSEFDLSISRLYASLVGMDEHDARHFRTMAATLQAFETHLQNMPKGFRDAR